VAFSSETQLGTVENHGKNGKKNTANFCKNVKLWPKNTAFWQNHGIYGI